MAADTEHLDPDFREHVNHACRETGASVLSGAGKRAEQERLFHKADKGGPSAAVPGTSWHEFGDGLDGGTSAFAVDFRSTAGVALDALRKVRARAEEFGLCFPVTGEIWHAQPVELTPTARFRGVKVRLVPFTTLFPEELELPMEFTYVFENMDFLWLGAERIHTRCGSADVLEGLKKARQIVGLGKQSPEFHQFLSDIAKNAGFS